MACAPGTEATHDLFLLTHGQPQRCWCVCHWIHHHQGNKNERGVDERDAAE